MPSKKQKSEQIFHIDYHNMIRFLKVVGLLPSDRPEASSIVLFIILMVFGLNAVINGMIFAELKLATDAFTHSNNVVSAIVYFYVLFFRRQFWYDFIKKITEDIDRRMDKIEEIEKMRSGKELRVTLRVGGYFYAVVLSLRLLRPLIYVLVAAINPENTQSELPPPMALPIIFDPLFTYILDSLLSSSFDASLICIYSLLMIFSIYFESCCRVLKQTLIYETKNLNDCIMRHIKLMEMLTNFKSVFGLILFIDCFVSLANICLVLFSIVVNSEENSHIMTEIAYLVGGTIQFWLVCWYSERLLYAGLDISDGVYQSQWMGKKSSEQRKLLFIIVRAQGTEVCLRI